MLFSARWVAIIYFGVFFECGAEGNMMGGKLCSSLLKWSVSGWDILVLDWSKDDFSPNWTISSMVEGHSSALWPELWHLKYQNSF